MPLKQFEADNLKVYVYDTRAQLGAAAAGDAAEKINKVISEKGEANIVFAAAPSQNETLEGLLTYDIDWSRISAFHMDEYIGLAADAPAGFGNFLRRAIFDRVSFKEVHLIADQGTSPEEICENYTKLLKKYPPDIIMLGIGENGHLAFNDPPVADFSDPETVKIVRLDEVCRQQQVNDGCFPTIDEVPKKAVTLTMSAIMSVPAAIVAVPAATKANAVYNTINGPVSEACPASILRRHKNASLYLDKDSAKEILKG